MKTTRNYCAARQHEMPKASHTPTSTTHGNIQNLTRLYGYTGKTPIIRCIVSHGPMSRHNSVMCHITWAAPCENMSLGICGQRIPRSVCAFPQSNQGFRYPLRDIGHYRMYNREQMPEWDCACAGFIWMCIFHMFEGTFLARRDPNYILCSAYVSRS